MEQKVEFPITQTKVAGVNQKFNLADPAERKEYFQAKVGAEIEKLKNFLSGNTFVAYMLGKKNSGKGTYTKLMAEIFGADKIAHLSVGDLVRQVHLDMADETRKQELLAYLQKNYRGYISVEQSLDALLGRDTKTLLPTEFILALLKREIDQLPRKALFIDGFPRDLDQVSYSLFFRDLINYREDPDVFVAISIPESVIDARMKFRVICPKCKTPRSPKFFVTKDAGYDPEKKEFYLMCDNPECGRARMVAKEGDNLGIEAIRERLDLDEKLINKAMALHGMPKVFLRNAIPAAQAAQAVDDYELTPEYYFELGADNQAVIKEKTWIVKDDDGVDSYSLLAPPVVVALIKQLVIALAL